jgi:N-acetylglucosamine-6-phosphate deacetylase
MSGWFTLFTNCRYILNGELVEDHLVISDETGLILRREGYIGGEAIDLEDSIIAPGFLELHTNGANGFHFTHYEDEKTYATKIDDIARYYATQGVTGFWATLPTVKSDEFQKVRQTECSSTNSTMVKCNTPYKVADTPPDSPLFDAAPGSLFSISAWRSYRRPIPTPH